MSIAASRRRLVRDGAPDLDPARRSDDDLRLGVLDAVRQLARREAAEDDGMDRSDPRTRQHGHYRFRDHRHVDDHSVAALDAVFEQHAGKLRDLIAQLPIGEGFRCAVTGES